MNDSVGLSKDHSIDQSYLAIWLIPNTNEPDEYYYNTLVQLKQIVDEIIKFTNVDTCIDFLTTITHKKVIMVITTDFNQQLVSLIHDIIQLYSIYIFSKDTPEHDSWTNKFKKVKGVSNSIEYICKLFKQHTRKFDYDSIPISIVPLNSCSTKSLNELPPSFMYSQILKEILFNIGDHPNAKEDLVHFLCQQYFENENQLKNIDEFDKKYYPNLAVLWYTKEKFIYSILNQALRTLNTEIIIKMGFFLRDLHKQIKELYDEQSKNRVQQIVYRGQGMSNDEFDKLRKSLGGLLSFNGFLSTSANPFVSEMYYSCPSQDPNTTAVLFKIEIDSNLKCAPFAVLGDKSNFEDEEEILFSMHSVFRIVEVSKIDDHWECQLAMTEDNDKDLTELTEYIRKDIQGGTGWHQLSQLLINIGNFDKAEEIYQILINQTSKHDSRTLAFLYNQLGYTKHRRGDLEGALKFYHENLQIEEKYLLPNHPNLAAIYSNIASINVSLANYSKAFQFYKKTLEIEKICLPPNSPDLATTYLNIGILHKSNGEYQKAIKFYQKALEICEKSLPLNHPTFILIYNNIAAAHYHLEEYSKALDFHEKTLQIEEKSLPSNHPHLAMTHSSIGLLYKKMGDYTTALMFYDKALEIFKTFRSSDHPDMAAIYNNIASLHQTRKEYSRALEFYQKTLEIEKKTFGLNHPELAGTHNNIASLYDTQGEHFKAIALYQQTLLIYEKHLPSNHLAVANVYSNIGVAYYHLQDYSKALSFFQRTLPILQNGLPEDHQRIIDCKGNIFHMQSMCGSY